MAVLKSHFQKKSYGDEKMSKILNVEIENNSLYLNGEKISNEDVENYIRNGLKYEGLKERFGGAIYE